LGQLWVRGEDSNHDSINEAFQDWQGWHAAGSIAEYKLDEERKGFEALLRRSGFRRVWVLQEMNGTVSLPYLKYLQMHAKVRDFALIIPKASLM
jgi:hypothetical protein